MKYLGISVAKYVQQLCEENYNTLINEIREEPNKWRSISCSWIGGINMVKI